MSKVKKEITGKIVGLELRSGNNLGKLELECNKKITHVIFDRRMLLCIIESGYKVGDIITLNV